MQKFHGILGMIWLLSMSHALALAPSNGLPTLRLAKSVFASDEAVFFWVGVQKIGGAQIPAEYWDTCRLTMTRPDGTKKTTRLGWPIDGPVGGGWAGGCGLGERPRPGRYLLVFEFAGKKTAPTLLTVQDFPTLRQIKAEFIFGEPIKLSSGTDTSVTLSVHNDTSQTIRFPHRDGWNGLVSVALSKPDGSYTNSGFYPDGGSLDQDEQKMPSHGFEEFSWKDAKDLPTITLKPGEAYSQQLSLRTFVADRNKEAASGAGLAVPSGTYRVTFSTTLQVLVGEDVGGYAAVSPIHVPVVSTQTCSVTQ